MARADDALAYLEVAFTKDPLLESEAIVQARNRFLGVAAPEADTPPLGTSPADRDAVREAVVELHAEFPSLDGEAVLARATLIDAVDHPDLAAWLNRMRRCAAAAPQFGQARLDKRVSTRVLDSLAEIAIANEEDATVLRSRHLRRMDVADAIKTAKIIQTDHAPLHELEPEWFARVRSMKRDRKLAASPAMFSVGFVVIYVIFKIVSYFMRQSG